MSTILAKNPSGSVYHVAELGSRKTICGMYLSKGFHITKKADPDVIICKYCSSKIGNEMFWEYYGYDNMLKAKESKLE